MDIKKLIQTILSWGLRLGASFILLQTLVHKFTPSELSVHIFSSIDSWASDVLGFSLFMEPVGRIAVGVQELIVGILILIPHTLWIGALGAILLMLGAVFFHLVATNYGLGWNVEYPPGSGIYDNGMLFFMGVAILVIASILLIEKRADMFAFIRVITKKK